MGNIQISGKVGDVIAVIAGENASDFQDAALSILGPDALDHIGALFTAALLDVPADKGQAVAQQLQQATRPVGGANGLSGDGSTAPATPAQAAVTTPQTPATTDGPREETDKWGNVWTYAIPAAPSCPHGPRVQKKGTSQAGKKYTGWECITKSPHGFRSKMQKSDCSMEWAR